MKHHVLFLLLCVVACLIRVSGAQVVCTDLELPSECSCGHGLSAAPLIVDCVQVELRQLRAALQRNGTQLVLTRLTLNDFDLTDLPDYVFEGIVAEHLDLAHNRIEKIAAGTFSHMSEHLQHLDISNNALNQWPDITGLEQLRSLKLNQNNLTDIPSDAFVNSTNLQLLRVSHNQICSLQRNVLDDIRESLQMLDLSFNCLTSIPAQNLRNAINLVVVDLSHNQLPELANMQFMNLPELTEVHLSGNRIVAVRPLAFMNVPNLRSLHLDQNQIEVLEPGRFQGFNQLATLNLSSNLIESLSSATFKEVRNLRQLYLDNNKIEIIETLAFSSCVHLQLISLRNNLITAIYRNAFDSLPQLSVLHLTNNSLSTIDRGMLEGMQNLADLRLDENDLSRLGDNVFAACPLLTSLTLAKNRLRSLPIAVFHHLHRLFWLDLSSNLLHTFNEGVFPNALGTLLLNGNRFVCDPDLDWFIAYLVDNNIRVFLPGQADVACAAGSNGFEDLLPFLGLDPLRPPAILVTAPQPVINKAAPEQTQTQTHIDDFQELPSLVGISPDVIRHVLNGGQIPGVPKSTLDALVAQYMNKLAQGHPVLQQSTANPNTNINNLSPQLLQELLRAARTGNSTSAENSASTSSNVPSNGQQQVAHPVPASDGQPRPAIITGLPAEELMQRLPPNFDLGRLPPELLQQIASGQPMNLALMPADLLDMFVRHNPDLADQVAMVLEQHRLQVSQMTVRPLPTLGHNRPPSVTYQPYDIGLVDHQMVHILDEKEASHSDTWLKTGIGLAVIAFITVVIVAFFCFRTRPRSEDKNRPAPNPNHGPNHPNHGPNPNKQSMYNINSHTSVPSGVRDREHSNSPMSFDSTKQSTFDRVKLAQAQSIHNYSNHHPDILTNQQAAVERFGPPPGTGIFDPYIQPCSSNQFRMQQHPRRI